MGDVTKALVLPDLLSPDLRIVRNLAVYWDEIALPNYGNTRYVSPDDPLFEEGVVRELPRDVPPEKIFPVSALGDKQHGQVWGYVVSADDQGLPADVQLVPLDLEKREQPPDEEFHELSDESVEAIAGISLGEHLGYIDDALAIAAANNLAPVSHSIGGHLAAVAGSSQPDQHEVPAREAALLSVVVDAFSLDPSVSSEEVLAFRARSREAQGRLRASLVDLAAQLRSDQAPMAMLAEARDTYRNRVEPALGDLEEVLKESGVKFLLKSAVGATAIALAPIEPISTSAGAARVMGQTIDYSYSKKRLIREHPYGYLHEIRESFDVQESHKEISIETALMSPRESLWEMWRDLWKQKRDLEKPG